MKQFAAFLLALLLPVGAYAALPFVDDTPIAPPQYQGICALPNWTVYNVKSFGAKGDGATDDTLSIRMAIAAAAMNGQGIVYFPTGTYMVCPQPGDPNFFGPIFEVKSNLAFQGDGPDKSIISCWCAGLTDPKAVTNRFIVFQLNANSGPISNVQFRSLSIDGNAGWNGNYAVGDPQGWDIFHKCVRCMGDVNSIDKVIALNADMRNFRGEIFYAGGPFGKRMFLLKSKVRGSNGSAVSVSADLTVDSSQLGGPNPGDNVNNTCENYAIGIGQKTVIHNSLIQATPNGATKLTGSGVVYIGPSTASLSITDSTLTNNFNAVLLAESAFNVLISNDQFLNNQNAVTTTFLGLYNTIATPDFENIVIEGSNFNSSGMVLTSQPGRINGLLVVGNALQNHSWMFAGNFTLPPNQQPGVFMVARNTFAPGTKDASTYSGQVGIWRDNIRPVPTSGYLWSWLTTHNQIDMYNANPVVTIQPMSELFYLGDTGSMPRSVVMDPTQLGLYPDGYQCTLLTSGKPWTFKADPTWNDLTADYLLPSSGMVLTVNRGRVYVSK